ncbi:MAG: hypothetical protein KJ592_02770 [Nanoarchaeota archaeon]|nr:hypothetical protein [Nanoarchaeota archaeon]
MRVKLNKILKKGRALFLAYDQGRWGITSWKSSATLEKFTSWKSSLRGKVQLRWRLGEICYKVGGKNG